MTMTTELYISTKFKTKITIKRNGFVNIKEKIIKQDRPVKIVQFDEGNFLRRFVGYMKDLLISNYELNILKTATE